MTNNEQTKPNQVLVAIKLIGALAVMAICVGLILKAF